MKNKCHPEQSEGSRKLVRTWIAKAASRVACEVLRCAHDDTPFRRAAAALLTIVLLSARADACSIPVFRYALDRWPADPFTLEISATDSAEPGVARFVRNWTDSTPLNLALVRKKEPGDSRLVFPHPEPATPLAWSGALTGDTLGTLIDSPARKEIVRRIMTGDVGVWVLVESGEAAADQRAAAGLEKRLRYLEQVAQLPQIDPNDPSSKLGPGPALKVGFSLLRVPRNDAAEAPFLRQLAGPKNDATVSSGPWLALVFGRGRVLGAWPAEGFGDEQIDEACLFLLGACSCQVKRMNPGWDLLLHHDWNEALQALGIPALATASAEKPTAVKPTAPAPETVTISPTAPVRAKEAAPDIPLSVAALVALGVAAGGWFLLRKP